MTTERPVQLLVLACYFKGERFMEQAHRRGAKVYLLTQEKLLGKPWPRHACADVFAQRNDSPLSATLNTVSYLARTIRFDRIVGLDDYDIEVAAGLREHLRMPGMNESTARFFRDKLACRMRCRELGIPVPEFTPVFNNEVVAEFIARVPAPWMLKPRSEASATGIHKVESAGELWPLLESKGDKRSFMHLEKYLPGDVYHVDALTSGGKVVFAEAHRCGTPPFNVAHGGGMYTTVTVARGSQDERDIKALNERALVELGMRNGASHVEFIKSREDGRFYLLETGARVGGAHIAETVEAATGGNLWEEWANLEIDSILGQDYRLPETRKDYGGLVITLARQQRPDLSSYAEPEVFYRAPEDYHAGLVVRSPDRARVNALLESYQHRFRDDFFASLPVPERAAH